MKGKGIAIAAMLIISILGMYSSKAVYAEEYAESAEEELFDKGGIALEKYNTLLKSWSYNPAQYNDTDCDFPEFYGGAYLNRNQDLVIKVTVLDEEVIRYFAGLIDLTDVLFEEASMNYSGLLALQANVAARIGKTVVSNGCTYDVDGVGISVSKNTVSVCLYPHNGVTVMNSELEDAVAADINALCQTESVKVVIVDEKIQPLDGVNPDTEIVSRSVGSGLSTVLVMAWLLLRIIH